MSGWYPHCQYGLYRPAAGEAALEAEHGSGALDLMRTLKRAIDPDDIMNPGKIVAL
jgi:FAD/FMN-containing dehydrogenase